MTRHTPCDKLNKLGWDLRPQPFDSIIYVEKGQVTIDSETSTSHRLRDELSIEDMPTPSPTYAGTELGSTHILSTSEINSKLNEISLAPMDTDFSAWSSVCASGLQGTQAD